MPAPIKKLADKFLSNPKQIEVARPASANLQIEQAIVECSSRAKKDTLIELLYAEDVKTAIIFSNRKTTVRELQQTLSRKGFKAGQIQGDMDQSDRIKELDRFKNGDITILVASDVAARGLDVKGVSHVFNYDVPWHPDDYVHRIGRTGRAGATGKAFTLATPEDAEAVANIEKLTSTKIPRVGGGSKAASEPLDEAPAAAKPARAARKPAEPRAEKPVPAPRAAKPAPAPRRQPDPVDDGGDANDSGGWNGPLPGFLGVKLGG
jgi:superfamily II DNA/RNA helicase